MEEDNRLNFGIMGYGRMGHLTEEVLRDRGENLVDIIDPDPPQDKPTPEKAVDWDDADLDQISTGIVFTGPEGGYDVTTRLLKSGTDAVVCTTKFYLNEDGTLNEEMLDEFDKLAKNNGSRGMYASNLSLGMNAIWKHLKSFSQTMSNSGYDVAIEERHHNKKGDVAGTAKTIGEIILEAYPDKEKMNFGDCGRKREPYEITVSSTRAGHIPGTHIITFDSPVDTVQIIHRVRDPKIFPKEAVNSAYWLRNQEPGLYSIKDRVESED